MYHVHIKNNHHRADTFPNTPEGEEVFTITQERFDSVASAHSEVAAQIKVSIDWDTDNFDHYMATADVLVTWISQRSILPRLRPA